MLEELQRRNYSAVTTRNYLRVVSEFAKYFGKSPDRLGPNELRTYQAYLLQDRKLTPGTVVNQVAALRFFFVKTLKRQQFRDFLPYPQDRRRLPTVLSREEVSRLINAAGTLFRRTLLMTLYGTGMRRAELARLKVCHIDSQRMIIRVDRLLAFDGERVTFRWKDYTHDGKWKQMTLAASEFLRRFFLHVLPKAFVRIRHFGFLANCFRARRLSLCRQLLTHLSCTPAALDKLQACEAAIWHCPHCGATMVVLQRFTAEELSKCVSFDSS